jgi:hypothetical protein
MKMVPIITEKFTICVSTLKSRYFKYVSYELVVHNEPIGSNIFQMSINITDKCWLDADNFLKPASDCRKCINIGVPLQHTVYLLTLTHVSSY